MSLSRASLVGVARRRWLWALTVVVLLGLLLWIPGDRCTAASSGACVLPDDPLPQRAAVGDAARLRLGAVTVDRAQAGTRVTTGTGTSTGTSTSTRTATTQGRFVLVSFTVVTADKPRALGATLRAGKRSYTPVRDDLVPSSGLLGPGLPGGVQKLFELPLDAATEDLVVEADLGSEGDFAQVDLGRVTGQGTLRLQGGGS